MQNGQLTGMLAEYGRDPIRKVLPAATDEELVGAIERAGQYLNSFGITSCMDAAVGMHSHFREIGAYFAAERSGRLPVRTYMCLLGDPGPKSIVPDCHRAGLVTGAGHDMLRVGAGEDLHRRQCGRAHRLDVAAISGRGQDGRRPVPDRRDARTNS